jgi:hypothetical protein
MPHPVSGLAALLDALEQELLSASAEEIRDVQRDRARAWETDCQEIRSLLTEALAPCADSSTTAMPFDGHPEAGLHRH